MATNTSYVYFKDGVTLTESVFGSINNEVVKQFTWRTEDNLEVTVISYGAIIQAIKFPDKNNVVKDIALGFDDINSYVTSNTPDLLGCVVGRCANRIARATFDIDGRTYNVTKNLNDHHLHGGFKGFDKANWHSTVEETEVILSYLSRDGEEGYPGDLITNITYKVTKENRLLVEYLSMTNKKTVINLTNHSYFNLGGHETGASGLYEHTLLLNSDIILEGDEDWVPTGKLLDVGGTPYDLRVAKKLGDVISNDDDLRYHHNFVVTDHDDKTMNFMARIHHPPSGRYMEVRSNQPSLVVYTGNFIQGRGHPDLIGKGGVPYSRCSGICLEPMNLVDAIHHQDFPSPILKPGEVYRNIACYRFGVKNDCK